LFASAAAAMAGVAVLLLNPNTLYVGAIPMTESVFLAALCGLLYFTVRFRETQGWGALLGASIAALAGTLTRYETWFLLPFIAIYIWSNAPGKRWTATIAFCLVAGAGPALWLVHNRWYFGDPLYFYRGPYSALALQGKSPYPGRGDWRVAAQYFFAAGQLIAGWPALLIGGAGILAALASRVIWPLFLLALPPIFYVWAIHSSGVPLFVPTLWPHTWYNTRYALSLLPLIAIGTGALARFGKPGAIAVVILALSPFLIHFRTPPVTWVESDVNSRSRREWTSQAADYLRATAGPHETFITSFGEMTGIYRTRRSPSRYSDR
jgi:hypothetical protein